jgi:hypothetical protein
VKEKLNDTHISPRNEEQHAMKSLGRGEAPVLLGMHQGVREGHSPALLGFLLEREQVIRAGWAGLNNSNGLWDIVAVLII